MNMKIASGAALVTGTAVTHSALWLLVAMAAVVVVVTCLFVVAMFVPNSDHAVAVLQQWVRMIGYICGGRHRPRK